jgi:hypothetical protein
MFNAYDRSPRARRAIFLVLLVLLVVAIWGALLHLGAQAGTLVAAESPQWDGVVLARVALPKLVVAVPVVALVLLGAVAGFAFIDHSELGPRLFHFSPADEPGVKASKKSNVGLVFAALLLGLLTVAAAILR